MLENLIDAALKRGVLVLLALGMLVVAAFLSIPRLNLDAFPDVTNVQVTVNTEAPGLAAQEVEQLITFPIEAVMYALPDVKEVRSISKTGLSAITVVFKPGSDIYFARQLVFERLQTARSLIPDSVGVPNIGPNSSGLGQIFQYVLIADDKSQYDIMSLRSVNDWVVKMLLMPIEGVTEVLSFGGEVRQYQVALNPTRLLAYQLKQSDVEKALQHNNSNAGGWFLNRGSEQLVIRGVGWLAADQQGLQELRQIPLKTIDGAVITIADVGTVALGSEIRQGAVTMTRRDQQGNPSAIGEVVSGIILKRTGANTNTTIKAVQARQSLIQQALPEGVRFEVIYDQADLITKAVSTVVNALLIAFGLIVVVLALFLMNLTATFLVLISIPIAVAMALMVMALTGMSANLMSLAGLAIAIGMLVDGSVVMVDSIYAQLGKHDNNRTAIAMAAKKVARPVFFATSIILVVFLPLFSFEGVEAKLFQPMAVTIIVAMLAAVTVALIVVPVLAVFLFDQTARARPSFIVEYLQQHYRALLTTAIQQPKRVMTVVLVLLVLTVLIAPRIGTEFVPELEEGTINLRVTLAPSASLDTALQVAPKLEAMLLQFPEVKYALSRIGRPEIGSDPEPVNNIEIYIGLKPQAQWQSADNRLDLQRLMHDELQNFPGLLFNFSQPIATRVDELLSGVKAQLAIKLIGPDLTVLAQKGGQLQSLVKAIEGTRDVAMEQIVGEAQLVVRPKRRQLSRYGLDVDDVMTLVANGLGGVSVGQIISGNERYDINLRYQQSFRSNAAQIRELRLQSPSGAWVRLGEVADIAIESGPPQIRRDDVQRRIVVQANVQNRDMGSVVTDIQNAIAEQLKLPPGYSVDIGGQYESQQRAQKRLILIVPVSLLLIALLLYLAFGSFTQALLILLNVPLAVIGGVLALYISGHYLSVPSAIGFITLFGVAVLNGVVLVERINEILARGVSVQQAVIEGTVSRLRPVLMTAITSALGMLPLLLSNGAGAEIQKPLAVVIVGGLVTATLLTLFVLPVLYPLFSRFQQVRL